MPRSINAGDTKTMDKYIILSALQMLIQLEVVLFVSPSVLINFKNRKCLGLEEVKKKWYMLLKIPSYR